jgi:hypothetical protein
LLPLGWAGLGPNTSFGGAPVLMSHSTSSGRIWSPETPACSSLCGTAQTLRWHFKYAIEQKRAWILTAWDGPRLFAYAILERRDAQSPDLVRVLLIDFQALVRDRDLASAMVSFILSRCRREHIQVLDNVSCWLAEKQPIANRPPHYRGLGGWSYLYQPANQELADALSDAEPWYPTPYDADASL